MLVQPTSNDTISFFSHKHTNLSLSLSLYLAISISLPFSLTHTHTHTHKCKKCRQLPKSEVAKQLVDHPWLHFTQWRHRKINCTNWVTEFIKLVFSFSTFISHSLCGSIPEVTLRVQQWRRRQGEEKAAPMEPSRQKASAKNSYTSSPIPWIYQQILRSISSLFMH